MILTRKYEVPANEEMLPYNTWKRVSLRRSYNDLKKLFDNSNRNAFMTCSLDQVWDDDESCWYYLLVIQYDDVIENAVNKILKYYGLV